MLIEAKGAGYFGFLYSILSPIIASTQLEALRSTPSPNARREQIFSKGGPDEPVSGGNNKKEIGAKSYDSTHVLGQISTPYLLIL